MKYNVKSIRTSEWLLLTRRVSSKRKFSTTNGWVLKMTDALFSTDDAKWKAVIDNNSIADGTFYYAVITTGVFCRQS